MVPRKIQKFKARNISLHDDKKVVIALAALFLDGEETGKGKNYKTLKGSY